MAVPSLPSAWALNPKAQTLVYSWMNLVDTDVELEGELGLSGGGSETSLAVTADIASKGWVKLRLKGKKLRKDD